ncbi:MAG: MFS transporter [Flavobacteriaceae bacterium]|nr:MFS transporter [Flavobacteriaceae bacterium]
MSETVKRSIINPRKTPFFYGYLILLVGTIGIWASVPGQTIGVSVFTDPVKDALGLSRNQFSNAYMLGTILSSLVIGRAGIWFDRYGARIVAFGAALTLALALVLCSFAVHMSTSLQQLLDSDTWIVPFVLMIGLFFLLRFSGQGVLTMASRNVIMIWFDKHRGKVNSFSSVALSFGFSASPLWLNALIEAEGWAGAWRYLAAGLLVIAFLILIFYKNSPEAYGLFPDGTSSEEEQQEKIARALAHKQFTLKEARRTRAFWIYALILAFNSFFITGFTFHVISIFADAGMSKGEAIAIFLPCSVVSVSVSTLFNFLSDYVRLKWYLFLMILGGFCAVTGLLFLASPIGVVLVISGIGILGGFFAVLNAIAWPRFFGRSNLGAITGKVMSLLILGSALAPPVFSWYFSALGSYKLLAYPAMIFLLVLAIGALKADNPQPKPNEE